MCSGWKDSLWKRQRLSIPQRLSITGSFEESGKTLDSTEDEDASPVPALDTENQDSSTIQVDIVRQLK